MVCACFHDATSTEDRARLDLPRSADAYRPIFVRAAASGASRINGGCSDEKTDNPLVADDRNFYKLEKWIKDGTKLRLLYAGNNLGKACGLFANAVKHRPRIRLTIRQRTRVRRQRREE